MYESIKGTLKEKQPNYAVVECSGIAYRLLIPLSTYTHLPPCDSSLLLYLSHIVREDAHILYAFIDKEDRNLFELLLNVSGIGPKTAAAIIGHIDTTSFQQAISNADLRLLSKLPGIGKKTAERLVIEMRDKFKHREKSMSLVLNSEGGLLSDAVGALVNLGYDALASHKAASSALAETAATDLGCLITAALRKI